MIENINQNPEQKTRDNIEKMFVVAGWVVQSKMKVAFSSAKGVTVRECQTDVGLADYVLFADRKPVDWEPAEKFFERIKNGESVTPKNLSHAR